LCFWRQWHQPPEIVDISSGIAYHTGIDLTSFIVERIIIVMNTFTNHQNAADCEINQKLDPIGDLLVHCKRGDTVAFRSLVERYTPYAFALAFRFVTDDNDAEDIVQDSFIRVWNNLAMFDERKKFSTWFYRIVVNLCYDRLRRERRWRSLFQAVKPDESVDGMDETVDVHEKTATEDLVFHIRRFAERLPLKQRTVFILRDLQELSVQEVADILHISTAAVKSNLCYARQSLRCMMETLEKKELEKL
jgi:RNA polymerase sigma-70 factor (ECF subfamily)